MGRRYASGQAAWQLRDRLIAELNGLRSSDDAAKWAHRNLPEKNKLTTSDARAVEDAFHAKFLRIRSASEPAEIALPPSTRRKPREAKPKKRRFGAIDKSALAMPEPRRVRDRDQNLSPGLPRLICGRQPADAHRLRFAQSRALKGRVHGSAVPRTHREAHKCGDEAVWWRNRSVDPTVAARSLWDESRSPQLRQATATDRLATPGGSWKRSIRSGRYQPHPRIQPADWRWCAWLCAPTLPLQGLARLAVAGRGTPSKERRLVMRAVHLTILPRPFGLSGTVAWSVGAVRSGASRSSSPAIPTKVNRLAEVCPARS